MIVQPTARRRRWLAAVSIATTLAASYFLGIESDAKMWTPAVIFDQAKRNSGLALARAAGDLDPMRRMLSGVASDPTGRQRVPCPAPSPRVMVALVFGQSNSANYGGERFRSTSSHVINAFDGTCYLAQDPLLGADGNRGSAWVLLGSELVARGAYDDVVVIAVGVGKTRIARWAPGGDLNQHLLAVVRGAPLRITHVLFHQGEQDLNENTDGGAYTASLASVIDSLRRADVHAPFFVSVASGYCGAKAQAPVPNNPVTDAQRAAIDPSHKIFGGPDTDQLIPAEQRYDGCHFDGTGLRIFAAEWERVLISHQAVAAAEVGDGAP